MKCLIVDDEPTCRMMVKCLLSPYGHCDLAFDGREAIGAFRMALDSGHPYDLICLDIMMPGLDGHDVLASFREMERQRGIRGSDGAKVVMTTALMDSRDCVQAFSEGCESYVTKPVEERQLLAEVRKLLGELYLLEPRKSAASPHPAPQYRFARPVPGRFLVVDDDRVCRELLKEMLSPYGHCDFAHDGAEAADALRLALEDGAPYDLVCLDIMMPGTSGHDALMAIRALEAAHDLCGSDGVKVVMTTALRNSRQCIQAFREGCESFVTKPIDEQVLLKTLCQLGVLSEQAAV
jgi:two-component system chemotaxis response regulator CheY